MFVPVDSLPLSHPQMQSLRSDLGVARYEDGCHDTDLGQPNRD